jgi:ABC-2 type transport system permease protein
MSSGRFWPVAFAIARRTITMFVKNPVFLVPSIIFPLFFFAAFAGGLSSISNVPNFDFPSGYTAFQFVFVLLQSAAFGGVFTGFGIARDFETGFARRFMLAADHRSAIIVGYAFAALTRALITWLLLFVVALIAGMQVGGGGVDIFGMLALAVIVNQAATLWAAGIALRFRTIQAGPMMQIPVFFILFLAPVYVPLDLLSGWIHTLASINPTTAFLEAGRGLISGEPTKVALAFAAAIALVLTFSIWALRGLRRAEAAG